MDQSKKTMRHFYCRDVLWETFEQMANDFDCSIDYLINESMRYYAKSKNYQLGTGGPQQGGSAPPQAGGSLNPRPGRPTIQADRRPPPTLPPPAPQPRPTQQRQTPAPPN